MNRGLATKEWLEMFPDAEVQVLEVSTSDHMPLMLHLHKQVYARKQNRFRFENLWIKETECRNLIHRCWSDNQGAELTYKLVRCCARLEEWGGRLIKDMKNKFLQFRSEMQRLRTRRDREGVYQYGKARWQYLKLLEKQKTFWRQRAKRYVMVTEIQDSFISTQLHVKR